MSSSFHSDACSYDDSQSAMMETSLWDDLPSVNPYLTPPRHESTPSRKTYSTRRSSRLSNRKRSIPCDENTPINMEKAKKRTRAATTSRKSKKPMKPVNLWDKAMSKNKDLAKFIESYNEQMEKICSTELSIRSEPNASLNWFERDSSIHLSTLDDEEV